jgi:hypothetical protein
MIDIFEMHDCDNLAPLVCKKPPQQVANSKMYKSQYYRKTMVSCSNTATKPLSTANALCHVECLPGYNLINNDIKCKEKGDRLSYAWAQIIGSATCEPVKCGTPPDTLHARHPNQVFVFPQLATYTCQLGYMMETLGTEGILKGQNLVVDNSKCDVDGMFSIEPHCVPVPCGECPQGDKYPNAVAREEGIRTFTMQCTYDCAVGHTLDRQAQGTKMFAISCMATKQFQEPKVCKPVLCGPPQDHERAMILKPDKHEARVFPEVVTYNCKEGHSLTGKYGGEIEYDIKCKANAMFSKAPLCKPVTCGVPAEVANSVFSPAELVFTEAVVYLCNVGYTFTGEAGDEKTRTLVCGAKGEFDLDAPTCKPVKCGVPPEFDNTKLLIEGVKEMNFALPPLEYQCKPGYSTYRDDDPWEPFSTNYALTCKPDGTLTYAPPCVDIKDCNHRKCGDFGSCVDLENPKGTPFDDYTCQCDRGYEETLFASTARPGEMAKICTNINDCPTGDDVCGGHTEGGIRRGKCIDLIVGYSCVPGGGYAVSSVQGKPRNQTVTPVKCGKAPVVQNADLDDGGEKDYDSAKFTYNCKTGYTLDGKARGHNSFEVHCSYDASFFGMKQCLPINCGRAPKIAFADRSPKQVLLYFPDVVTYMCEEGYTINGKADGEYEFDIKALANGKQEGAEKCLPVFCGEIPADGNAKYPLKDFVFPQAFTADCNEGFSVDGTVSPPSKHYHPLCQSDGTFAGVRTCERIKCGVAREVMFTKRDTARKVFQDSSEYVVNEGYSLDGQASGKKAFTVTCQSDGTFSAGVLPKPVSCGSPPTKEHATFPEGVTHVFKEQASYTCAGGHSVDAKASSAKNFVAKCQHDGTYEEHDGCSPVECGPVVVPKNGAQTDGKAELVFTEKAAFKCSPGFSTDGWMAGPRTTSTRCQANGKLTMTAKCLNMDDCEANMCRQHGKCVDNKDPTGVHKDDYHCVCNSGYEEMIEDDGTRYCGNIPDCPKGACMPGECQDLVNDYKCHCDEGYHEGPNLKKDFKHDCLPNVCGTAPKLKHATAKVQGGRGSPIDFSMDPIGYTCGEGYSLDGSAAGDITFTVACQADKNFAEAPPCLPVSCGFAPDVQFSTVEDKEYVFQDDVHYECKSGYSLTGMASGTKKFSAKCTSKGLFDGVKTCVPVACPDVKPPKYTTAGKDQSIVYSQRLEFLCATGFTAGPAKEPRVRTFDISCEADGKLKRDLGCFVQSDYMYGDIEYFDGLASVSDCQAKCAANSDCKIFVFDPEEKSGQNCWLKCAAGVDCKASTNGATEGPTPTTRYLSGTSTPEHAHCGTDKEPPLEKGCVPLDCGKKPEIDKADVEGSTIFGGSMTATAHKGYTLDGTAGGPATFTIACLKDGQFSEVKKFQPVVCGVPPEQDDAEAPVVGEGGSFLIQSSPHELDSIPANATALHARRKTHRHKRGKEAVFGDVVKYSCNKGHAADENGDGMATIEEMSMLKYECKETGELVALTAPSCLPLSCPVFKRAGSTPLGLKGAGYMVMKSGAEQVLSGRENAAMGIADMKKKGQTYDEAANKCDRNADCKAFCHNPDDDTFYYQTNHQAMTKVGASGAGWKCYEVAPVGAVLFGEQQPFQCVAGYSLDGTPSGETTFIADALTDGTLDKMQKCKHIDWCLIAECTGDGDCVNGDLSYTCDCHPGFQTAVSKDGGETCEEIDECMTLGGVDACTDNGKCVDKLLGYNCECNDGYEVTTTESGLEECSPVVCGNPPAIEHSSTGAAGEKLGFPDVAEYTCGAGYTLDGKATGEVNFEVSCDADKSFGGKKECKPVDCGKLPTLKNAEASKEDLKFPDEARYTCAKGHETVNGKEAFAVSCADDGQFTEMLEGCFPVVCGRPDSKLFSAFNAVVLTFQDKVTYTCNEGYTITGKADGAPDFSMECFGDKSIKEEEDPKFEECHCSKCGSDKPKAFGGQCPPESDACSALVDGPGCYSSAQSTCDCESGQTMFKNTVCMPVTCGVPPSVENAESPHATFFYMQQFQVFCDKGYSTNGQPDGEDGFVAKCAKTGEFEGMQECKPVSCGKPTATEGAESSDPEQVFLDSATWTCKDGYSTNGRKNGPTTFEKMCTANGAYGDSEPKDCMDIDFCYGSPCGYNGECTDSGSGVTGPGYECTCNEGFEMGERENGGPYCKADDCAGDPCGKGGSCTDLSKADPPGPEGSYTCDCEDGFELDKSDPKKPTCSRRSCGTLVDIKHLSNTKVNTQTGEDATVDSFTGRHVLKSFDVARFRCEEGYSTDGSLGPESKSFSVECMGSGALARPLNGDTECQPVRCDNMMLPSVENSFVANEVENFFEYGNSVKIQCLDGYSINGRPGGKKSFEVPCQKDGKFPHKHKNCYAISCGYPPTLPMASASSGNKFAFTDSLTYACKTGFAVSDDGDNAFTGECGADGRFAWTAAKVQDPPKCKPVPCGPLPTFPEATPLAPPEQPRFGNVIRFQCGPGKHLGGIPTAAQSFMIRCKDDGTYSLHDLRCMEPKFNVQGEVTDAQSAARKIAGATVTFKKDGATVGTATTDLSGRYSLLLVKGEVVAEAVLAGYITRKKTLTIGGNVYRGQGADLAMSKVLPPGAMRVTVAWTDKLNDVDSHTYFGPNYNTHVYWPGRDRIKTAPNTAGIKVVLDRDDVNGVGPETTTFMNLGNCRGAGKCLVKFAIKKYGGRLKLPLAKPVVTVYEGDRVDAEYILKDKIPMDIGTSLYTVFTIWGGSGGPKLYEGEMKEGPFLSDRTEVANWWGSLDSSQWSMVPANSFLTGLYRHPNGLDRVYGIEEGRYRRLVNSPGGTECYSANWWGSYDREGWSSCNAGYFLSGVFRTGNMWDGTAGIHQIEMGHCCKPKGGPAEYGECSEDALFDNPGLSECAPGKAITALWRSGDNSINGMDKMKCCETKGGLVKV